MKKVFFTAIFCLILFNLRAQHVTTFKDEAGRYGFKDLTGIVTIEPVFDDVKDFSEGLAAVKVNSKWGFIDKTGEFVIPLNYTSVTSFKNGKSKVAIVGRSFFIDKTGKQLK